MKDHKIIKKLKSNKGVALEMAIIVILVMYSLCYLLFIVSYKEKLRDNLGNYSFNIPTSIEQVGEDFVSSCKNNRGMNYSYDKGNYYSKVEKPVEYNNILELTLYEKESEKVMLIVQVEEDTNKIVKWYFNNPNNAKQSITDFVESMED